RFSWFDAAVFVGILLIVFHPNFPLDPHHYNYFLGPANDQLNGKPMLYETTHLYGFLDIYALAFVFRYLLPLHYPAAALLITVFFAAFFAGAYWFMRSWFGSRRLAAVGAGILIVILYLFQTSPTRSALFFPSMSPFRYGWYLPVLFLIFSFGRRRSPWLREAAIFVAVLSVLWTFDFGAYLAAATFAALWCVETRDGAQPWRQVVALAGKFLLYGLGIFAVITALNAFVYGSLPNWFLAVRDASHFGAGISMAPLPTFGIFEVYLFAYLLIGLVLWSRYRAGQPLDLPLVFLVIYGAFSVLYYIGESSWQIVYAAAGPFVFVLLYVFQHRDEVLPSQWLRSLFTGLTYGLITFAFVLFTFKFPVEMSVRNYGALRQSFWGFGAGELSFADEYADAQRLRAMFPRLARLALISHVDTPVLVYAGKTNFFDTHYLFGNVLFKPQMRAFVEQVQREKPPVLFVGRRRDDQIEFFLAGVGDQYERVAELRTLDVYRRR
ncbi:hypothetical protein HY442_00650, partial [Candidatus Parcubacteria bacterium]|nr:hypothetical protein [Candidatus Parcubacteria bacterium]